jgi:CubicO group peptidase (beta-lactamase class C family)
VCDEYHPPPEADGGWRFARTPSELRDRAELDPARLAAAGAWHAEQSSAETWGLVVIRHGWIAHESYSANVAAPQRFDLWSCTKSFAATAWGLAFAAGAAEPATLAYPLLPEAHPLSDPRKAGITLRHLLTMTSGIPGEAHSQGGVPADPAHGAYEYAFGHAPSRYGKLATPLTSDPGTAWDYSDAAFAHLSPCFAHLTGEELDAFLQERVFGPLGMQVAWDSQGGGGHLGPHANAHTGLHASARDLARFGLLLAREGRWAGHQIVPSDWIALATQPSQQFEPAYGWGFWTNARGAFAPGAPRDLAALAGFRSNRCYVIPSLDLVIARVGTGPLDTTWDESALVGRVVDALA